MEFNLAMKKLLLTLAFLFAPSAAWAQCTGVFPANTLCGNLTGSPQPPAAFSASGTVVGPGPTTIGHLAVWNNTLGTLLADGGPNAVGVAGAIQMALGTGGFADSTFVAATCAGCTGNFLQLPFITMTGGGSIIFGNYGSAPGAGYNQDGHEFIGCMGCQVNTSAGGTTAFVGWDGTTTPIIGNPSGSGGFHMAAFGTSVNCQGDEATCIGHNATVIGTGGVAVGSGSQSSQVAIGQSAQDTSSGGSNVIVGGSISLTGTTTASVLINAQTGCTINNLSRVIGIGRAACPTASDHAVIGGPLLTDFYAGTDSGTVAAGHFSTIIHSGPKTETANYNPTLGDNSIIFNCSGTCSMGLGNVAVTGYRLRIRTIAAFTVVSLASNVVPLVGGAAGTAILAATAGKWADLEYDGTNWQIMAGN